MPYKDAEEQTRYQREWIARRQREWLEANGPCARCGSKANLEMDHIDPATKVSHRIWAWSAKRREAELAKCQVLCHPCHVDKGVESGELMTMAKLTEGQVVAIRTRSAEGETKSALAREMGVHRRTIGRVIDRQRYSRLCR